MLVLLNESVCDDGYVCFLGGAQPCSSLLSVRNGALYSPKDDFFPLHAFFSLILPRMDSLKRDRFKRMTGAEGHTRD